MAERLPKYRPLGASIASVGNVSYARTGQAKAQASNAIANALNKVTDFVYEEAKEEAVKFGAENAPTAEQFKAAQESGVELEMPTGDIARTSALKVMSSRLEAAAKEEIANFRLNPANRLLDPTEYAQKINAIGNGYAATLNEIDPVTAVNFQASIATSANTSLRAHIAEKISNQQENDRAMDFAAVDTANKTISTIVAAGPVLGSDGTLISTKQQFEAEIPKIYNLGRLTGAERKASVKTLTEAFQAAQQDKIANWVSKDPNTRLEQLMTLNVTDPGIALDISEMTGSELAGVFKATNDAIKSDLATESAMDARVERQRKEASLEIQANLAAVAGNPDQEFSLMEQLRIQDPAAWTSITNAINTKGGTDVDVVVADLERKLTDGTLTYKDVYEAQENGNITGETRRRLTSGIKANSDTQFTTAMDYTKSVLGYPDRNIINPGEADRKAMQQVKDIRARLILERARNPDLDALTFVMPLIEQAKTQGGSTDLQDAKASIDTVANSGLFGKPDISTIAGLEALKADINLKVSAGRYNSTTGQSDIYNIDIIIKSMREQE